LTDYFSADITDDGIMSISALGLAHMGDAVYELMVRTWLMRSGRATARGLHRAAVTYVSAPAQARGSEKILRLLSEEETAVFRRGRNTRVNSVPRSASLEEYHASTALETLFGYLYLKGRKARLNELFEIIITD
jgi:ribonuclease-3 family protein